MANNQRRAWRAGDLQPADVRFEFSPAACSELLKQIRALPSLENPEQVEVRRDQLEAVTEEVELCRRELEDGRGVVVIQPCPGLSWSESRLVSWTVANLLGTPLVQNSEGNRLVNVYDRDRARRMADGARYHQTREGGSIHTDNVNIPEAWEYLVFSCVQPAFVGGESILVNGRAVHERLRQHAPEALELLQGTFWWEYRGIADKLYEAPVITCNERGEPLFRYLRPYLESAHHKAGAPLTDRQSWALDVLDSLLDLSELQFRYLMGSGEIMLTMDSQVLHGRTCFADHFETVTLATRSGGPGEVMRRTMDRTWIRRV